MLKLGQLLSILMAFYLPGCSVSSMPSPSSAKVIVVEYPPLNWSTNAQKIRDTGCQGKVAEACPELFALGCDKISGPAFFLGGLQPPYTVMECIHENSEAPNKDYFRRLPGLDPAFHTYAIFQDGKYKLLIKKSEFKVIFAPVESTGEAISFAMAMTSLSARFDINSNASVEYLVDVIEETHAIETSTGYLVYLFDSDHEMGCNTHSFYAVKVFVTRQGEIHEVERQEIYRSKTCFDFGALSLE